jgi:uncharacterized protein YidB (DUF937 family)
MASKDEIPTTDDAVKAANEYAEKQRTEAAKRQAETLAQMEKNQEELRKKQEQLSKLSEALGINEMRHKLDQQDQSITYLASRMDDIVTAINNLAANMQTPAASKLADNTGIDPAMKMQIIQDTLPRIVDKVISKIFPDTQAVAAPQLISQDLINEKMTKAFMDDLETGESIRKFISDTLKKKATQTIVKQSLGNMGMPEHEPV